MENNHPSPRGYHFLAEPQIQRNFAALNIELLRGKHIMSSSPALFAVLDEFERDLANYYHELYGLVLERRSHDSVSYFYLEFPEVGKGSLSHPSLYGEMDGRTTVVACILANLYFSNYFSYEKEFHWEDIQYEIEHGEHSDTYQQLFFGDLQSNRSDKQWEDVRKLFSTAINFFHRIGLVEKEDSEESVHFTILPTIHHFIDIYKNEIEGIDEFLQQIKL